MTLTRLLALIALALATASPIAAETTNPITLSRSDESTIRELETNSWVAWKNHDATFFERLLSEDHVEVHSTGIVGKAAVVDGVRASGCVVQTYSLGQFSFTPVSADTVLLTYRAEQDTTCGPLKVPSPVWATSVYTKRGGIWVNVLYQYTPVARS